MDPLNPYLLLTLALFITTLYLLLQPHPTSDLARWLQEKNYQYEVTSSLYMLTPTEKFVFSTLPPFHTYRARDGPANSAEMTDSILFLTLSLLAIATVLYLPAHVKTMSSRAYFYFAGPGDSRQAGMDMGRGGLAEDMVGV